MEASALNCHLKNDLVPDPTNCQRYYECTNWFPLLRSCRLGQHFNGGRRRCMPESEAFCRWKREQSCLLINHIAFVIRGSIIMIIYTLRIIL